MHAESTTTLGFNKHVDSICRICMDCAHHPAWIIGANWDQAQIKRPSQIANLLEDRTPRKVVVFLAIVIFAV